MKDTYTFEAKNKDKILTITVKSTFLKEVPHPEKHEVQELLTKYNIVQFYHNLEGPAIEWKEATREKVQTKLREEKKDPNYVLPLEFGKDHYCEYWIDGKRLSDEEAIKMMHSLEFNGKLDQIINE